MPSFVEIGSPILEKKIFKCFYHIWAWRRSWSCDLDYLYILSQSIDVAHDVRFPTVYSRIYSRKCLTLFNQTSPYILKCILASMCVLYKFYPYNKIEIGCMLVLVVGSESSQNWVRVVSGLGPIRLGSEKYQGSELSWVRVVRLPA